MMAFHPLGKPAWPYGLLILILCVISGNAHSQTLLQKRRIDSLTQQLAKDSARIYRLKVVRPFFSIDSRNSWMKNVNGAANVPVNINGFQAGIVIKDHHTVGLGFYSMSAHSKEPQKLTDRNNHVKYQHLRLGYATLFYQYVIVDHRFFQLDLPLEIGTGSYDYYLSDSVKIRLPNSEEKGPFRVTGGGVSIVLKPVKWIGVTGMGGYRFAAVNKNSNLNVNGLYYSYGVWIDFRQLYMDSRYYLIKKHRYKKAVKRVMMT